ncbi:SHD1 domain-containing protein [Roseibacillus persicicus]|uniref:SHD1 domain-containing protein n=1 Tax=Roseibacillus persicicus TaxID=454148 RepID=UPI00398A905F
MKLILPLLLLATSLTAEVRTWTSQAGSKIEAEVVEVAGDKVTLKRSDGKEITAPIASLSEADQKFLREYSQAEKASPPDNLPHPLGRAVGPIKAENSHYFLYLPNSLVAGRRAPLLFFTGSGGGNLKMLDRYIQAAEVGGWIVAVSKETRNNQNSLPHVLACMKHLETTLPVDSNRLYFTGASGGGQRAMMNAAGYKGAGAIPIIYHGILDGEEVPSKGHYYFIGGAQDYNRYGTAAARRNLGRNAFHRFHPGGHNNGPDTLVQDGMLWLNARFYASTKDREYAEQASDFERNLLDFLEGLPDGASYRAFMLLSFIRDDYEISSANQSRADALFAKLQSNPQNALYLEALADLDELSEKDLSEHGVGTLKKHTSKKVSREAARLRDKYPGLHEIPAILENLQKPTK